MERRRWTVERVALWLAVLFVLGGGGAAVWGVTKAIDDRRIEVQGKLDAHEILLTHHPFPPGRRTVEERLPRGYAYLSSGEGTMTQPEATAGEIAAWSALRLLPWLAAAAVLAFLVPILRAAERGDPFRRRATRRMQVVGSLLLVGVPLYSVAEYVLAESAVAQWVSPGINASVTIGVHHFLPGLLVLALAGIFARGVELQDLERHTV